MPSFFLFFPPSTALQTEIICLPPPPSFQIPMTLFSLPLFRFRGPYDPYQCSQSPQDGYQHVSASPQFFLPAPPNPLDTGGLDVRLSFSPTAHTPPPFDGTPFCTTSSDYNFSLLQVAISHATHLPPPKYFLQSLQFPS